MMKRPLEWPAKMKTQAISGEERAKVIDSPTKSIADERLAELGAPANNVRIIILTEEAAAAAAAKAAVAAKPRFKPSSRPRGARPKSLEVEVELENYHPPPTSRAKTVMRQVSDLQDAEAKAPAAAAAVSGSHHRGQSRCLVVAQAAIFLGSLVTLVKLANGVSVDHCYSDIGCFPLSEEFYHPRHRPFNVRPWHRRLINTRFLLFNRQTANDDGGFQLEPWSRANLLSSRFNPLLETKIIIPGWLDSLERALWVKRLRDALLHLWQPINIIVVHWNNFTPYTIATANTRVVGAELANLLRSIETELNYDRAYYHLIGHSLGAHIAGYCGDRLAGLGRITALDPARPFFQHMPKSVRLDRGDAKFVDAIHSDFTPENAILLLLMSYGMSTPVGHVDFYPNGHAYLQPGCLRDTLLSVQRGIMRGLEHASLELAFLEALRYLTACDHQRSHEWFLESVTNRQCTFVGVRCNEFEGLINGRCTCDDSPSACAIMGIHADQMYVHNLHEDIWPLGQRGSGRNRDPRNYPSGVAPDARPSAAPATQQLQADSVGFLADEQIARPLLPAAADVGLFEQAIIQHGRAQIHQELLRAAASLRNQPPPMPPMGAASDDDDDAAADEGLAAAGLDQLDQDTAFIDYLRANFALQQQQRRSLAPADIFAAAPPPPPPLVRPSLRTSALVERADPNPEASNQLAATLDGSEDIRRMSAAEPNFRDDVELIFSGNNAHPMNKHPKLLSDLDRDIESWYEDSSRWFLKTNKRPNYCVNQYQILIYLGPLRSSRGRGQLRANLLVSIIGSRGKLINQRFIPRSAKLDSYTMQPFFVILEGAYSLGSILSVAVGWEASSEPDPIQATISFQSSLLEDAQASLPEPPRLRPYIGETIRFDHSDAFEWAQRRPLAAAKYARRRSSSSGSSSLSGAAKQSIARRSLQVEDEDNDEDTTEVLGQQADEKCLVEDDETGQCTISHLDMMHETPTEARAKLMTDLLLEQNKQEATGQRADGERRPKIATSNGTTSPVAAAGPPLIVAGATLQDDQFLQQQNDETSQNDKELLVAEAAANLEASLEAQHHYELLSSQLLEAAESAVNPPRPAIGHQRTMLHHFGLPLVRPAVPMTHDEFLMQANENGITATLHNIDIVQDHLIRNSNNNMDQDSIVINQIVVNPLQANYGKGLKQSKVFCPSRPSQRLRRDQTIRLLPNLLGRCPVHHNHHR